MRLRHTYLGKHILILCLFYVAYAAAQNSENSPVRIKKEQWRKQAHQSKINGDLNHALINYNKILEIDENDYDALLATARLYFQKNDFENATKQYLRIYKNDSNDVEALNGLGECYFQKNKYKEAISFFNKAIALLPHYAPLYLNAADAYLASNELKKAKKNYQAVLQHDSSSVRAHEGLGKIFYWTNKPKSALRYYAKAMQLNSNNQAAKKEHEQVLQEMKFTATLSVIHLKEEEAIQSLNTFTQRYGITKRLSDYFNFSGTFFYDHAKRYNYVKDSLRKFDNTVLNFSLLLNTHKISFVLGNSLIDKTLTSYGLNWLSNYSIKKIKIRNTFVATYDYFFYWNKIDQDYVQNLTRISYKKLTLEGNFKKGVIRRNFIWDLETKDINPYYSYAATISYSLLKNPKIIMGITRSFINYTARSPLYFSPYERGVSGVFLSPQYSYKRFHFYSSLSYKEDNYLNPIFSIEAELGYTQKNTTLTTGWSTYNDPYYNNERIYLMISHKF